MLKVGLTGGIGSGKTTVGRLFQGLGVPLYGADDRAKWLMANDSALRGQLVEAFGPGCFGPDGVLDRAYLAARVFADGAELSRLNALVHPAVARDFSEWCLAHAAHPYGLKEAAILFESGSHAELDSVVVVAAPDALRMERVMARDGASREQVQARMDKQMPQDQKVALADHVVHNDGQSLLLDQVLALHEVLLQQSQAGP